MYRIERIIFILTQYVVLFLSVILIPGRLIIKILAPQRKISLWAGTPIINMGINARAERLLGVNAKSLVYSTYHITNEFDYDLSRWNSKPVYGRFVPFMAFLYACLFAKRLHFYCDTGLIPSWTPFTCNFNELYIYKLLRIPVFFWTYGADVRSYEATKAIGEPNGCTECDLVGKACICDETKRKENIGKLRKYSVAIFSMGDMTEYTPGSRNDLFFWPIDLQGPNAHKYEPAYVQLDSTRTIRIVHAPNHRVFKGTHFLIDAVDTLRTEGYNIELILVERVPNKEALSIYRSADIIFDQCLYGFHGYFALEGMALGKPVMCFIRKPNEYLLVPEECPIINTHITTLKTDLRDLIENRELLRNIGIRGRKYIEKYYSMEAFALRLKNAYEDLGIID